jgi:hypothetical protein
MNISKIITKTKNNLSFSPEKPSGLRPPGFSGEKDSVPFLFPKV